MILDNIDLETFKKMNQRIDDFLDSDKLILSGSKKIKAWSTFLLSYPMWSLAILGRIIGFIIKMEQKAQPASPISAYK